MSRRIDIDDQEFDTAARGLDEIAAALGIVKSELHLVWGDKVPGELGARVRELVIKARATAEKTGESSARQADELRRRAVFARIADDRGTDRDLAMLVAMCAGPKAIDLKRRHSYTTLLNNLASAAMDIVAKGGKNGVPRAIDAGLERWQHWWGLQQAARLFGGKPKPTSHRDLYQLVFGRPLPKQGAPDVSVPQSQTTAATPEPASANASSQARTTPRAPDAAAGGDAAPPVSGGVSIESVTKKNAPESTQTVTAGPSTMGGSVRGTPVRPGRDIHTH